MRFVGQLGGQCAAGLNADQRVIEDVREVNLVTGGKGMPDRHGNDEPILAPGMYLHVRCRRRNVGHQPEIGATIVQGMDHTRAGVLLQFNPDVRWLLQEGRKRRSQVVPDNGGQCRMHAHNAYATLRQCTQILSHPCGQMEQCAGVTDHRLARRSRSYTARRAFEQHKAHVSVEVLQPFRGG